MNHQRRTLLKASMATGAVAVAVGAGLLTPQAVLAAWPTEAFQAKEMDDALTALWKNNQITPSKDIELEAPDIAENGAVVSVAVKTSIPNAEQISIFVPENVSALTASYILTAETEGLITSRIKMRKSSDVIAVVKAGDKLYMTKKPIKVTLGGCGG
ncbi:MAG: thiosulfate oxidation carrier protein SoxY [Gammaproteobacteria bacterium]